MTRDELAIWIVRMGEKYPKRIGISGLFRAHPSSHHDFCILGQIGVDGGVSTSLEEVAFCKAIGLVTGWSFNEPLARAAANANDAGMPWGEIPLALGLVPGEQPAEQPESVLETV